MIKREKNNPAISLIHNVRGTARRIAKACDISKEAVWNWKRVPAERVLVVSRVTKIPRHLIRPDIYPPPRRAVSTPKRNSLSAEAAE